MSDLPLEWLEVTFEQINFYQNQNINPLDFPNEVFELYSVPVFFTQKPEFLAGKEIGSSKLLVKKDDILVSKINPRINRVWQVHQFTDKKNIASSEWVVFRQNMAVPKFFKFYFESLKFRDLLCSNVSGVGGSLTRAQPKHIAKYILPLPPKAEQERIAELLDNHLAQVETIKARLNAITEILKKFRQSVLADAVSGRLTEDWRLGNKIDFDWKNLTINDISTVKTGKTPSRKESKYWDNPAIPWVTSSATGSDFCYITEEKISKIASEECNLKPFPTGSLILAMYGEGKTRGQVTELMIEATCNQACAVIIVNNGMALTRFVKLRLKENYEDIRKQASGGNQPNLNLNKVRGIEISLPTIEEQKEIVERVEQLFAYADTIETQVNNALQRVNQLTQSILHQAFTGQLTADWRAENIDLITGNNSAENLLEQIQKQKATPTKKTKKVKNAD